MLEPDKEYTRNNEYDFTGERFMPQQTDPLLALEHYHRYCLASQFAKNRRVLDIACGEGYGSAFLAKSAKEVVGIDCDRPTIEHATRKYSAMHNLTFKVGRCESGHEDLGSFDLVVSYETIEHIAEEDQSELLKSIGRILKQDGLFIVSSPEKNEYAAAVQGKNQFHKHEMTMAELRSRLEAHFKYVYLCGQRILSLSAIWRLKGWEKAQFRFNANRDLLDEVPGGEGFSPPLYLIALCSNKPLPKDMLGEANSFYFDTANVEKTKNFYEWAMQMDTDAQKSREVVRDLEQRLEERANWARGLQGEIKSRDEVIDSLKEELDREIKSRDEIIDSLRRELDERTSWTRNLQSEIKSRDEVIDSLRRELDERTSWTRNLQSEIKSRDEVIGSLRKELEERTSWATELQSGIRSRDEVIGSLKKEFEERTRWALSLESEVARERAYSAELKETITTIASSPAYRICAKIGLLPNARGRG